MIIRVPSYVDILNDIPKLVNNIFPLNGYGSTLPQGSLVFLSFSSIMLTMSEEKYLETIFRLADRIGPILSKNQERKCTNSSKPEQQFYISPLILPPTSSNIPFIKKTSKALDHLVTVKAKNSGSQFNALDIGLSGLKL